MVTPCIVCQTHLEPFLTKNRYTLYRCPTCALACTDLQGDYRRFVNRYYRKGYFTGELSCMAYSNYEDDKPYIVANMRKLLFFLSLYKRTGRLLDVGCALGFFIELAGRAGYDAYGIDPSNYAVVRAKKLIGVERIRKAILSDLRDSSETYDIVTMFDVFEHLADPGRDLDITRKLLKDDGIVVIATGDTDSVFGKMLGRRWTFYTPPQHLYYFNRTNLTKLLWKKGFEPVAWMRIGKWLSLRYVLHLARTGGESTVAEYLYRFVNLLRLGKLPLYLPVKDNMVVIARKHDRHYFSH